VSEANESVALEEILKQKDKQLEDLTSDMQRLKEASAILRDRYADLLKQSNLKPVDYLNSTIEEFKQRLSDLGQKLKEKQTLCDDLGAQVKKLEANAANKDETAIPNAAIAEIEDKCTRLGAENSSLESKIATLRMNFNNSKSSHDQLSQEFMELQTQYEELSLKHQQLLSGESENRREELEQSLEQKEQKLEKLDQRLGTLQQNYDELHETNETLRAMLADSDQKILVVEKDLQQTNEKLRDKIIEADELVLQLAGVEEKYNTLEEENDSLSLKLEKGGNGLDDIEANKEKYEALKKERDDLWLKLLALGERKEDQWQSKWEKLDLENASLRQNMKKLYLTIYALQKEYATIVAEMAKLKAEHTL